MIGPRRRTTAAVVLVRGPVVPLLIAVAGICLSMVYCIVVTAHGSRLWTHVAANAAGFGLFAWFLSLAVSVRVLVLMDGSVRFTNVFSLVDIPGSVLDHFDTKYGLEAVLKGGERLPCTAVGGSVIGNLTGYRRARRAVARYATIREGSLQRQPASDARAARRLRPACFFMPAWGGGYLLLATAVWWIRG